MLYNLMRKTNLHDKHSTTVPILLHGMVNLSSIPFYVHPVIFTESFFSYFLLYKAFPKGMNLFFFFSPPPPAIYVAGVFSALNNAG